MADLEQAADVAVVKVKELSAHVDKAEAALSAVEEKLEEVKEQIESDWAALQEKARVLLQVTQDQAAGLAEEGREARQGLGELEGTLGRAVAEWDVALEASRSETSALTGHVSETEPLVSSAAAAAEAAARSLAGRAAAIEAQLDETVAAAREFLEHEVARELEEMEQAVRQRAAALQATLAGECESALEEVAADWEKQLGQVEDLIEEEFAGARQHAAAVVEFSLEECRRGHDQAWDEVSTLASALDGLLQELTQAVGARTAELGERRGAAQQAVAETAARVEQMTSSLRLVSELLAQFEFVSR